MSRIDEITQELKMLRLAIAALIVGQFLAFVLIMVSP